jgi:glycosyltransferase involved in cell wall biosynthesis
MRIAWFSPLPPMPSGIADYSFELLPFVAEGADVETFCPPDGRRSVEAPAGIPVLDPSEFDRRAAGYDAVFYHLGNNPFHEFVYRAALRHPGVAVLHEFVLHHLIDHLLFGEGRYEMEPYERLLAAEYGEAGPRLAHLHALGAFTEFERFLFPLSGHVLRASTAAVVHSRAARDHVLAGSPDVPVHVIPHHAGRLPPEVVAVGREEARQRLGLAADAFLVGQFGFITRPKQPAAVLGGFARLLERRPDARLLVIGENQLGVGVEWLLRTRGLTGHVDLTGYVDMVRFALYLKAVDVLVNLRYPTAGEASGTFTRAMAEGRATIVSNLGSFAEYPDRVCLKVEVDGDQAEQVGDHLIRLVEDPAFKAEMELAARRHAEVWLDPRRCARLYMEAAMDPRVQAGFRTISA